MNPLIEPSRSEEPPLHKARRRMEAADLRLREAEELHDIQGPEAYPKLVAATTEHRRAETSLRKIETQEIARR